MTSNNIINFQPPKANQYTLRCSALRIESPFLKHDAVYFLKCSRRDFATITQFSATAKFGVATFRNQTQMNVPHNNNNNNNNNKNRHSRTLSLERGAATASSSLNQKSSPSTAELGFPARESTFWERPACLLNFKPSGNVIKVPLPNNCGETSSASPTTSFPLQVYSEKKLKIEILESLIPNQSISATTNILAAHAAALWPIGSIEIDLAKIFADSSPSQTKRVFTNTAGATYDVQSCFVSQFRIPFRFGEAPNDVGADLFMSFRFDAGDDVKRTPVISEAQFMKDQQHVDNKNNERKNEEGRNINNTRFAASSDANFHQLNDHGNGNAENDDNDDEYDEEQFFGSNRLSQRQQEQKHQASVAEEKEKKRAEQEAEAQAKKDSQKEAILAAKNNTSGKAIATVLPPLTTTISAVAVLQDLLNMLSEERMEESSLIKQINDLTLKKKALVLNNLLGGPVALTSPVGTSGQSPSSANFYYGSGGGPHEDFAHSGNQHQQQNANRKKMKDIQERLSNATNELLRTVCCDRIVMMYRSALLMALRESEKKTMPMKGDDVDNNNDEIHKERNGNDDDDDDNNVPTSQPFSPRNGENNERRTSVVAFNEDLLIQVRERTKVMSEAIQTSELWREAAEVMANKWKRED